MYGCYVRAHACKLNTWKYCMPITLDLLLIICPLIRACRACLFTHPRYERSIYEFVYFHWGCRCRASHCFCCSPCCCPLNLLPVCACVRALMCVRRRRCYTCNCTCNCTCCSSSKVAVVSLFLNTIAAATASQPPNHYTCAQKHTRTHTHAQVKCINRYRGQ